MASYYRVSPKFWIEDAPLWDDDTTIIALYLLTGPHRNLEGLYRLPKRYVQEDLGKPQRVVDKAISVLTEHGMIDYDPDAQVVFLCNALAYQAPSTARQITGAINAIDRVPPSRLHAQWFEAAKKLAPTLANAIAKRLECDSNGIGDAIGNASESHPNGTGKGSECDSNTPTLTQTPIPPQTPPDGGAQHTIAIPRPPERHRRTRERNDERQRYQADLKAFAVALFPDHPAPATVLGYVRRAMAKLEGDELTVENVRRGAAHWLEVEPDPEDAVA